MLTKENIDELLARSGNVVSTEGTKIGSIGQVYVDDENGQPTWVTVKTGLFGTSESFVPLEGARLEGEDVVVPYTKDQVKDAPRIDVDGQLDPSEEDRLYSHYTLNAGNQDYVDSDAGLLGDHDAVSTAGFDGDNDPHRTTENTDLNDGLTRSEERLKVGTEKEAVGRVRLRKYVTTENVTQTVPVTREEVRIEREPITDADDVAMTSAADLGEEEQEVILHEERPVVQKETVPVERVRLTTETVTDDVTIEEQVRKEHIETEGDDTLR